MSDERKGIKPDSPCLMCGKTAKDVAKSGCGWQHNGQVMCAGLDKADLKKEKQNEP